MSVSFELPLRVEQLLRKQFDNLDLLVKEAALVELYRQEKITRPQLSAALSLGRIETDGLLKQYRVTEDLPTEQEITDDVANLRGLLDK